MLFVITCHRKSGFGRLGKTEIRSCCHCQSDDGDWIKMTNSDWAFSIESVRAEFGFEVFLMVNDFTALAMALPSLPLACTKQCGGKTAKEGRAIGLIGARYRFGGVGTDPGTRRLDSS